MTTDFVKKKKQDQLTKKKQYQQKRLLILNKWTRKKFLKFESFVKI